MKFDGAMRTIEGDTPEGHWCSKVVQVAGQYVMWILFMNILPGPIRLVGLLSVFCVSVSILARQLSRVVIATGRSNQMLER